MLLIVLITSMITTSAIFLCLIATFKVFSEFGALEERSYHKILWLQILKTLREEKNVVRELRRCDERVYIFQCLVIYISPDKIYYVHTQARSILNPGLAICYAATILRSGHVCGVKALFLKLSLGRLRSSTLGPRRALSCLLPHHYRDNCVLA